MIVYLDLLFLSNFLLDWSLLVLTGHLSKEVIRYWRILLGTLIAVSSLVLFFVPNAVLFVVGRFIFSLAIIYVAFPYTSIKRFVINLFIFYSLSYLVAGVLVSLNLSSNFMMIDFFDIKTWALLTISFLFANILTYILKVQLYHHQLYLPIQIRILDQTFYFIGFYDTGNDVTNSQGIPVVFVQAFRLEAIDESFLESKNIEYEYVTWQTLNKSSTTLAFKPTKFYIKEGRRYRSYEVLIALVDRFMPTEAYQVILNKKIFE